MAHELSQKLAKRFIERAEALAYKGKKRDNVALDFFCGAAVALVRCDTIEQAREAF